MASVTAIAKTAQQPRGGYIKPSSMMITDFDDGQTLANNENIHASIIGMCVDYMTRFLLFKNVSEAFKISILGATQAENITGIKYTKELKKHLKHVKRLDDKSIFHACKAVTFDVWYRSPLDAILAKGADEINPDRDTINNIKILITRCMSFFDKYGPITVDGFTFGEKGYTSTVTTGDGDFLTADTLWDMKVSKSTPTSKHTLQLLMYYIMGQHSEKPEFSGIKKLGIFNPRLNRVYLADVSSVPDETIKIVEKEIIGF